MEKRLKNGLILTLIELPVPILKYSKWLEVKYPSDLNQTELFALLEFSFPIIEEFARKLHLKQIKIATNPNWSKLTTVGLSKTVYYVVNHSSLLTKIVAPNYTFSRINNSELIENLAIAQFRYHCQFKPCYFTRKINRSVSQFLKLVQQNINHDDAFLIVAKQENDFIGFLYGEIYKDEGCIDELFVKENFRNKGIGKTLVREAGKEFQKRKIEKIGLFVGIDEDSLGFYEKLGFKKEFVNWIKNLD